jgi:hypothetical protein
MLVIQVARVASPQNVLIALKPAKGFVGNLVCFLVISGHPKGNVKHFF